jgi:hypothetical protein
MDLPARYQPFRAEDGSIQLVQSLVLSLDLLGTRAGAADEAQQYLEVTRDALVRANKWADGGKVSTTVVRWFSDNLALADPLGVDDPQDLTFGFHLITAVAMQLELAMAGLFARGGIAIGPFYADETFIFGPALIEAYETESRVAIYPRIVLTDDSAAFARKELANFGGSDIEVHRTLLAIDQDGLPFLSYLESVFDEPGEATALLTNHKAHIEGRLQQHRGNASVHLKYAWLADYHDRFCRQRFTPEQRDDLMIGAVDGPVLTPFGEEVPRPEPAPDTHLAS